MGLCHRGGVSASEMGARLLNARYLNCLLPRHVAVRACCLTYLVIVYDGGPRGHLAEARSLIVATLSPVVWDAPQMVYVTMAELSPMFYLVFSGFQLIPDSYPGGALARESCRAHAVSSSFPKGNYVLTNAF